MDEREAIKVNIENVMVKIKIQKLKENIVLENKIVKIIKIFLFFTSLIVIFLIIVLLDFGEIPTANIIDSLFKIIILLLIMITIKSYLIELLNFLI